MKSSILLGVLVAFRVVSVFFIRTWFVPDEIFQSVEVAHRIVFNSGHLSWEWRYGLRSVLHPYFIAFGYMILKLLSLDTVDTVIYLPRLMHAVVFGISDYFYYQLSKRLLTAVGARFALFSYLTSWFVWYCATRTLSNSLETALMLIALNWYPLHITANGSKSMRSYLPYLLIAFLSIFIRPTAVLIWFPLGLWHLCRCKTPLQLLLYSLFVAFLPLFLLVVVMDSLFYGHITVTLWNFASFNVFEGGSENFGTNPFYWYFSEGLFSVLTVHTFPVILGILLALVKRKVSFMPLLVALFYVLFHSFLAHKEHRFLLPVIPFLCLYSGYFFSSLSRHFSMSKLFLCFTLITVNLSLASYFGLYHQSGPNAVNNFIVANATNLSSKNFTVVQLMPCYSMPYYSYLHGFQVTVHSLDCTPNFYHITGSVDEADRFYENPQSFLLNNQLLANATYVVVFSDMYKTLAPMLENENFKLCGRFFHAHFLTSERQSSHIHVACKS
uniref:Mannosyltransferase n=1 Tax=Syphacia muris TaxID=451379 RepID=A0A0N5AD87_9BILA